MVKHLVLDMDGVLWHGDTAVPGLQTFFLTLSDLGIRFVLATNNATKVAEDYVKKLAGFGVIVPPERILTSAEAAATFLRQNHPPGTTVYVVGDDGLKNAILQQGFSILTPEAVRKGQRCGVVVAGLARSLSYELLAMASLLVAEGAEFIASNTDATFPTEIGNLPGAGAVLSVITTATGVRPLVIGKPEAPLFLESLRRLGCEPSEAIMVGDRLNTDIAGALAVGMQTVLLLSGVTQKAELVNSPIQAHVILNDLRELTAQLQKGIPFSEWS